MELNWEVLRPVKKLQPDIIIQNIPLAPAPKINKTWCCVIVYEYISTPEDLEEFKRSNKVEELTDAEARIIAEQLLRLYAALLSRCRAKGKK